MASRWRRRSAECLVSAPTLFWLTLLFVVPTLIVFAIALKPATPYGGIGSGWTFDTLRSLGNPSYPAIIWRTVWISLATTALCLLLALPTAYLMARVTRAWRSVLLLLVIVPFWTSFLVRVFAWKLLLHPEGTIKRALVLAGLASQDTSLLYRPGAVLLVSVYSFLPFAILPIYAAAEKFDYRLVEAARDLGASAFRAFRSVFLPGIRRGLLTATLVVFVPSLGSYVIPDLVGGPTSDMVGNKIAQRTFSDRNLPQASALSALLTLAVLAPMVLTLTTSRRKGRAVPPGERP